MRILINREGVKREINGAFSICGTKEDIEILNYFISEWLLENHAYGWCDIHSSIIKVKANESPYDWWQEGKS